MFSSGTRRHGAGLPFDRAELERWGWRTTLDYQENHGRRRDGRLDHLEVVWRAEAERTESDGSVTVVVACGPTPARAWTRLRAEADLAARAAGGRRPDRGSSRAGRSRERRHLEFAVP